MIFGKRMLGLTGVVASGALLLTGCATVKTHPEFMDRHPNMLRLAVLPPDTEAMEITFNAGNKPLADLKELVQTKSAESIETALKNKGYDVTPIKIMGSDLNEDSALRQAVFDMQTLYKQAIVDIQKNKKKQFTYDIGSSANYFAEKHSVNAIVLTRQVATRLSDGVIAAQLASSIASAVTIALVGVSAGGGVQPHQQLTTEIAIIDADLGDILWYHLGMTTENFTKPENSKPIQKAIDLILKPLPDSKSKKASPAAMKKATPASPALKSGNFASSNPKAI